MAYKFQIGQAALSGALEQAGEITFLNGQGGEGENITRFKTFVALEDGNVDVPQHNGTVGLQLAGTLVTADASDLNLLDTAVAGTVVNSKAVIYSNAGIVQATDFKGPDGFDIGNASNADALKFNASEIVVKDGVDLTVSTIGGFNLADGAVTSTAAELNLLDGSSAATVVNSKGVIYGAAGQVNGTSLSASTGMTGSSLIIGAAGTTGTSISNAGTVKSVNLVGSTSVSSSQGITGSSLVIGAAGTTGASLSNTGYLSFVGMADDWTNASNTVADLGSITTVDINGGTVDGAVIGGASAAAGTFTTLVATGDVDLGDATSDTITALARFDSDLVPSTSGERSLGTAALKWDKIYADEIVGADTTLDCGTYGASPYVTTISGSTDFALIKSGSTTGLGGAIYTLPTAVQGKVLHVKLSGSQANVSLKAANDDIIEDGVSEQNSIYLESTGSAVTLVAMNNEHWYII